MDKLGRVQRTATKMIRDLDNVVYKARLEELEFFRLEKGRLSRHLIRDFKHKKGFIKKTGSIILHVHKSYNRKL